MIPKKVMTTKYYTIIYLYNYMVHKPICTAYYS